MSDQFGDLSTLVDRNYGVDDFLLWCWWLFAAFDDLYSQTTNDTVWTTFECSRQLFYYSYGDRHDLPIRL